jgi:hypothetical protein
MDASHQRWVYAPRHSQYATQTYSPADKSFHCTAHPVIDTLNIAYKGPYWSLLSLPGVSHWQIHSHSLTDNHFSPFRPSFKPS